MKKSGASKNSLHGQQTELTAVLGSGGWSHWHVETTQVTADQKCSGHALLFSFTTMHFRFLHHCNSLHCTYSGPLPTFFWRTLKMHSIESGKYQLWSALLGCLNLHWRVQSMISSYKAKFETMNPMQCIISIVLKCREWFAIQTLHPWGVCFSEYLQSLILQIPSVAKVLCWGDCFAI